MSRRLQQRASHAGLLRDARSSTRRRRLDALVVPAGRPASSLQPVIDLSVELRVPLLVLASRRARLGQIEQRLAETPEARAVVVEIPPDYRLWRGAFHTSGERFREAGGGRRSDLSLKRNLGLLLARSLGWSRILFVDDDITHLPAADAERLAAQLDAGPVASLRVPRFPDNSVVCHGRRLAGLPQDVFVSGAVLGVNVRHAEAPSFFPDVYNEDWLFFARQAAGRTLPVVGEALQAPFDPFLDPRRAAREEFGDVLAEGLYALFEDRPGWTFEEHLRAAGNVGYWDRFTATRDTVIDEVAARLEPHRRLDQVAKSLTSLETARKQLAAIEPSVFADFVHAWREDMTHWARVLRHQQPVASWPDAFDSLGLPHWTACRLEHRFPGRRVRAPGGAAAAPAGPAFPAAPAPRPGPRTPVGGKR